MKIVVTCGRDEGNEKSTLGTCEALAIFYLLICLVFTLTCFSYFNYGLNCAYILYTLLYMDHIFQ